MRRTRLQVVCFSTICQRPVNVLTGKVLREHFIRLEGFFYNVIKMTFFTVQFLIGNTIVLSVKEVVESMLKQNIRGTYILMLNQKFETTNERSLLVLMRGNSSSHREAKQRFRVVILIPKSADHFQHGSKALPVVESNQSQPKSQ